MNMTNLSTKQQRALLRVERFIPSQVDWASDRAALNDSSIGIAGVHESPDGASAESAFFMRTEHGRLPQSVTDKPRLRALLWGQHWMATHVAMWQEGMASGQIYPCVEFSPDDCALLGVTPLYEQYEV